MSERNSVCVCVYVCVCVCVCVNEKEHERESERVRESTRERESPVTPALLSGSRHLLAWFHPGRGSIAQGYLAHKKTPPL